METQDVQPQNSTGEIKESGENYLETILLLSKTQQYVRSIDIVKTTGFSKPSISIAMKKLKNAGFIDMDTHGHIRLTDKGYEQASQILERHNVLAELFISLGVSPKTAEEDACRAEHVISEETFMQIKKYLSSL